jgi:hypothetical protein
VIYFSNWHCSCSPPPSYFCLHVLALLLMLAPVKTKSDGARRPAQTPTATPRSISPSDAASGIRSNSSISAAPASPARSAVQHIDSARVQDAGQQEANSIKNCDVPVKTEAPACETAGAAAVSDSQLSPASPKAVLRKGASKKH